MHTSDASLWVSSSSLCRKTIFRIVKWLRKWLLCERLSLFFYLSKHGMSEIPFTEGWDHRHDHLAG